MRNLEQIRRIDWLAPVTVNDLTLEQMYVCCARQ